LTVDSSGTSVTIILHENEAATTDNDTTNQEGENQGGGESTDGLNDNTDSEQQTEDSGDNTSDSNQDSDYTADETITIKWTTGAEVFFNGEYVGVIKDGKLIVAKQIGIITVDLVIEGEDTITYDITVEDNGEDEIFSFPER
jgi:hypothetical protein